MRGSVTNEEILAPTGKLVDEEHELLGSGNQEARLAAIEVELDRYWDLLRRRRAARANGADPDAVELRDADTVEHYSP